MFVYYKGFISQQICNNFKGTTFVYFSFAVKLKYRLYGMGNELVCYIAAIFLRIFLMSIAYQGNVIKVARNKKVFWEKNVIKDFFS